MDRCSPNAPRDVRGSNEDRRRRKIWMLWHHDRDLPFDRCRCVHCGWILNYETVQADRIEPGGSYRRENVQPACAECNRMRGNDPDWVFPYKPTGITIRPIRPPIDEPPIPEF